MPLYGIISDIHGNAHALRAALKFLLEDRRVDAILCLGDIVGYNPSPDTCLDLLEEQNTLSIAGNHDLIAAGALGFERCSPRATFALRRTRATLHDATRRTLALLPARRLLEDEILLTHGGLADVCQYITTPALVEQNAARMDKEHPHARLCLFGHTHTRKLYEIQHGTATERPVAPEIDTPLPTRRGVTFFLNPGSIDAARKQGPRLAELALFDSTRQTASFHQLPYDHEEAEHLATEQGYRMTRWQERLDRAARRLLGKR